MRGSGIVVTVLEDSEIALNALELSKRRRLDLTELGRWQCAWRLTRPTAVRSSNEDLPRSRCAPRYSVPQNGRVRPRIRLPPREASVTARLGLDSGTPGTRRIVIELDIGRAVVTLADNDAELLRDIAAAQAGRSAASRDLSLLLNQALSSRRRISLQRAETNTLRQLITADRRLSHLVPTFDQPASDTQA